MGGSGKAPGSARRISWASALHGTPPNHPNGVQNGQSLTCKSSLRVPFVFFVFERNRRGEGETDDGRRALERKHEHGHLGLCISLAIQMLQTLLISSSNDKYT